MKPDEAIRWAGGSQKALAERCGVTESAVSQWVDRGRIPLFRAYQLESLSAGELRVDASVYQRNDEAA
jgi:DNA-binding transcriptional regulator YdaS (Cro superfamily)